MRKWHRWLVISTGVFMFWIAATGFVGQAISLFGGEHHGGPPPAAAATTGAPVATATALQGNQAGDHDGPPAKQGRPPRDLYHFIIALHSGNYFGPVGKVILVLMGAVLLFFSISGMWMYIDMFRKRKNIGRLGILWD